MGWAAAVSRGEKREAGVLPSDDDEGRSDDDHGRLRRIGYFACLAWLLATTSLRLVTADLKFVQLDEHVGSPLPLLPSYSPSWWWLMIFNT